MRRMRRAKIVITEGKPKKCVKCGQIYRVDSPLTRHPELCPECRWELLKKYVLERLAWYCENTC